MTKKFKLVGVESQKVYYESNVRPEMQRWLDEELGSTYSGVREKKSADPMPEAMKIEFNIKG